MSDNHHYKIGLEWTGNQGTGTSAYKAYSRDYSVSTAGKPILLGSSDPSFLGDPARHNPEDMFLASIASCHMLWYLHLASTAGIVVVSYHDTATGVMNINPDGSGEFTSVTLSPTLEITDASRIAEAKALHDKVGDLCFIARSINVPIHHDVAIKVAA